MFTVIISEKGGEQRRVDFDKPEVTIGRVQGNDIILPKGNVSKRHSRIVLKDGKFIIVDLKSTNGTYVNGRKITSPLVLKDSDKVYIGDFILTVEDAGAGAGAGAPHSTTATPIPPPAPPTGVYLDPSPAGTAPPSLASGPPPAPKRPPAPPPVPPAGRRSEPPPPELDELPVEENEDGLGPVAVEAPPPPPPPRAPQPPREPASRQAPPAREPAPTRESAAQREPVPTRDLSREAQAPTRDLSREPARDAGREAAAREAPAAFREAREAPPSVREAPAAFREAPVALREAPAPVPSLPHPREIAQPSREVPAPPPVSFRESPPAAPPPREVAPAPVPAFTLPAAPGALAAPASAAALRSATSPMGPRAESAAPAPRAAPTALGAAPRPRTTLRSFDAVAPPPTEGAPRAAALELVRELHDKVAAQLDLARVPLEKLAEEALWQRAETAVCDLVEQLEADGAVPAGLDQDGLVKDALNELLGLGPLEDLLADDDVADVLVDRPDAILVERGGRLVPAEKAFSSEASLRNAIDRLLAPAGRRLDAATPLVDVRLAGGTRVVAALPPIAVRGPCLTVRKPRRPASTLDELARGGSLSAQMAQFLATAVAARRNVVVCGGAGTGKSAVVAALAAAVPAHERVVSVEEVAELAIAHDHWVALEARLPEEGRPGVAFADVVRAALRMRPDRLVVGEVRGTEALEVLAALGTGVEGGVISVGGDSAAAALARLESLARLSAPEASARGLRELVAHAAHLVVTVARFADGVRRIVSIGEVTGPQGEGYAVRELFTFQVQGQGEGGVRGRFAGTGIVPRFYEVLQARGEPADASVFR